MSIRYDDVLVVGALVQPEGDRRLRVDYRLTSSGVTVATAHEIRAWALVGADGTIKGAAIDPAFLALCTAAIEPGSTTDRTT